MIILGRIRTSAITKYLILSVGSLLVTGCETVLDNYVCFQTTEPGSVFQSRRYSGWNQRAQADQAFNECASEKRGAREARTQQEERERTEQAKANQLRPYLERANAGDAGAAFQAGEIFERYRDKTNAEYWLKVAAIAGNGSAAYRLGQLSGNTQDALRWFDLAASLGVQEAARVASGMRVNMAQQAAAEARARADQARADRAVAAEAARQAAVWERDAPLRAEREQAAREQREQAEAAAIAERRVREAEAAAERQRQATLAAEARAREATEWAALPEEEKQRRQAAIAAENRRHCEAQCSSGMAQCRSSNSSTGSAIWGAFGGLGGGLTGLAYAGAAARNCDGDYASCAGSCR